jgi:hypothetical protein
MLQGAPGHRAGLEVCLSSHCKPVGLTPLLVSPLLQTMRDPQRIAAGPRKFPRRGGASKEHESADPHIPDKPVVHYNVQGHGIKRPRN